MDLPITQAKNVAIILYGCVAAGAVQTKTAVATL